MSIFTDIAHYNVYKIVRSCLKEEQSAEKKEEIEEAADDINYLLDQQERELAKDMYNFKFKGCLSGAYTKTGDIGSEIQQKMMALA